MFTPFTSDTCMKIKVTGRGFQLIKLLALILVILCQFSSHAATDSVPFRNNYYKKLLAQYFISLKEDEIANDQPAKAEDLKNIGNIFYTFKNYEKAVSYYRMSQQTYKLSNLIDELYGQYFSLGKVFRDMKQYDSAWACFSKSINHFKNSENHIYDLYLAYFSSGELFRSQSDLKDADRFYDSSIVISKQLKSPELFLQSQFGKAKLFFDLKDFKKSEENAQEGLAISREKGKISYYLQFLHLLYLDYKNLNKPDLAFKNLEAYFYLNDSLQTLKSNQVYSDMAQSYEAITREKENDILRQKNRNYLLAEKFYITALILGLLLITTLILLARKQRRKILTKDDIIEQEQKVKSELITSIDKEKSANDQLITTHQEALETVVLEKSQISDELERKNNDLLTATTYMLKTNEKLAEISANFRNIASKLQKSSPINEEIYQTIDSIEKLTTKDTWDNFRSKFVDVHPNFFKSLNEKCPGLTQNEMKLAAMISMNLSSKDIAKITMQQHNSINVARYRLRKKLAIDSEDQLIGFLLQL
jgi:DNA-binding CsgD family transcriptional regulator